MKKLFIVALLMIGTSLFAQEKMENGKEKMERLTPEQRNSLHLKKLTLDLNLTPSQQKEMEKLIAERSAKKQAVVNEKRNLKEGKVKLSPEERYAKRSQMLDEQIAFKAKVKAVLNPEQFAKWEKQQEGKRSTMKNHQNTRSGKTGPVKVK